MVTLRLNTNQDFDFTLIGIVSSEPIYRISWLINELLHIQLKESQSIKIYNSKTQIMQEFLMHSYFTNEELYYHLIQNKGQQGVLIEEQKQVDYWMKITNLTIDASQLVSQLNTLKNVNLTFGVKPGSLKSKSKLLFFEEE